jgi:hypothetical protein
MVNAGHIILPLHGINGLSPTHWSHNHGPKEMRTNEESAHGVEYHDITSWIVARRNAKAKQQQNKHWSARSDQLFRHHHCSRVASNSLPPPLIINIHHTLQIIMLPRDPQNERERIPDPPEVRYVRNVRFPTPATRGAAEGGCPTAIWLMLLKSGRPAASASVDTSSQIQLAGFLQYV